MTRRAAEAEFGSPAWAGIDPQVYRIARWGNRFPRVGGDRPKSPEECKIGDVGSPAWAGIDLR